MVLRYLSPQFLLFWSFTALAAPITLQESFQSAKNRNETILQGQEQVLQADAKISQLKGGILPNLSFNVGHQIQPEPSDPVARSFSPPHQTTMNFSLAQPIFRGLREWQGLDQLESLRSAQEATQAQLLNRLFQEVATNYLQILGLEQDLKNLKEQSEIYEKRVQELSARVRRGESNQSDVLTAESTLASLSAEIGLIEGQAQSARETFRFLTGADPASELIDPNLFGNNDDKTQSLAPVEKYLARIPDRPDFKAARDRFDAADSGVSMARAGHFPSIDAVGNYYLMRPGFLSDLKWDIGLRLTLPLFEGGATQAKISEAISKRKEGELEMERVRRSAEQEIRSLHQRLTARLKQMKNLRRTTELSKKNNILIQRDYRRGLSRNIDVQLALTESRVAQRSFDQAHFASQLDMLQLQLASAMAPTSTAAATTGKEISK